MIMGCWGEPANWLTERIMYPIPIPRIALPFLALAAASGAALVYGVLYETQPSPETRPTTAAAVAPTAGVRDEGARAVATERPPAVSSGLTDSGDVTIPTFDVALVGQAGDAVIAGTAAPGAAVELLRNGEPLDRVVADQFGQFVMTPSRLSPGDYDLTLRSRQGNGKLATSRRSVAVKVAPSLTDDKAEPITSDKASVLPAEPMVGQPWANVRGLVAKLQGQLGKT